MPTGTYQLNLTLPEINLVLAALGKQPADMVYDVISAIRAQAKAQIEAEGK